MFSQVSLWLYPRQVVADNWWSAVRDYQKQGDARKAGDLLLLIGETYMKVMLTVALVFTHSASIEKGKAVGGGGKGQQRTPLTRRA